MLERFKKLLHEEDVSSTIKKMVKSSGRSAKTINSGSCGVFAYQLHKKLPGSKVKASHEHKSVFPGHEWVYHKGKHYDAESPEGVKRPKDLHYSKRMYSLIKK